MKNAVKILKDTAFNIGYTEGLMRDCRIKNNHKQAAILSDKHDQLCRQWETLAGSYIKSLGDSQDITLKQLKLVLLTDRAREYKTGLKQCSENLVPSVK